MSGEGGEGPYLEPVDDVPAADERPYVEPVYLEVATADESAKAPQEGPPRKRKVRAAREQPEADAVWLAVLAAVMTERPLLLALWPDATAAAMLRQPPTPDRLAERCGEAMRAFDAIARRDDDARARADVAHRSLQQKVSEHATPALLRDAAVEALRAVQLRDLAAALTVIAAGARHLDGDDLRRLAVAAADRGLTGEDARGLAAREGYELREGENTWSALDALPGAPRSLAAAAAAVLRKPTPALQALRDGAVARWVAANDGPADVIEGVDDARRTFERGSAEGLALHRLAWALGGRELVPLLATAVSTPEELAAELRSRRVTPQALAVIAREGTLAAWLRLHGRGSAADAADLLAKGAPSGPRRLGWALGEPFAVGGRSFSDPSALAREAAEALDLRGPLGECYASGDLLAWLESLPPTSRHEDWILALRDASQRAFADTLALWSWVYRLARRRTLTVASGRGQLVTLTSLEQLKVTQQVADVWDGLKLALRTGDLAGWLGVLGFESSLDLPRPPVDEDIELNALLWEVGHRGLVLEWGRRDFAVSALTDLVRAYQEDCAQLEGQVRRGYVLAWLDRFHGETPIVGKVKLRDVTEAFRAEIPRLPSGYTGLKLALLCGLRYLPVDPTRPGDAANHRGFVGVGSTGAAGAWEPLREHVAQGAAQLWLARLPDVGPRRGPALALGAFMEVSLDALDSDATASSPPAPAKGRGRKRVAKPPARPIDATIARLAKALGNPQPSPALAAELSGRVSAPPGAAADAPARASVAPPLPSIPPRASVAPPPPSVPPRASVAPASNPYLPGQPLLVLPPPSTPPPPSTTPPPSAPPPPLPAVPAEAPRVSVAPASMPAWRPSQQAAPQPSFTVWAEPSAPIGPRAVTPAGPPPEALSRAWFAGLTGGQSAVFALALLVLLVPVCCCFVGAFGAGR
ncbi:MAG: hypothetical protein U0324_47185 [Polyangiales bacterium]